MSTDCPYFCSPSKFSERWNYGGKTREEAIETGLDLWGGEDSEGFYIASSNISDIDNEDESEHDYTIDNESIEFVGDGGVIWKIKK